jgi:hypothetical protein
MSEKLSYHEGHHEKLDLSAETKRNLERLNELAETAEKPLDAVELQHHAEQAAVSAKEITVGEQESAPGQQYQFGQYKLLRADAYGQVLQRIRKHLNPPEKALSKFTHQPVVDAVSNGLAKTVARPSGILGAGVIALIGSSALIYMARHYGFSYNYFVFFILLAIGFAVGVVAEFLVRFVAKVRH